MKETYILMRGNTQLGILNSYEQSFPWIYCHFTAQAAFEAVRPLFEAELKSTEPQEVWEQAYDAIEALDLYLLKEGGATIEHILLHVDGEKAWFRF